MALGKLRRGEKIDFAEASSESANAGSCNAGEARSSDAGKRATTTRPRRLTKYEHCAVREHLLRLSERDRALRFFRVMDDAAISAYADAIDFDNNASFAIFDIQGSLIALAETFSYSHGGALQFEAAFSTDETWRNRGLGRRLFGEISDYALSVGGARVVAQCLTANRPMQALLRSMGASCAVEDGEVTGELKLMREAA